MTTLTKESRAFNRTRTTNANSNSHPLPHALKDTGFGGLRTSQSHSCNSIIMSKQLSMQTADATHPDITPVQLSVRKGSEQNQSLDIELPVGRLSDSNDPTVLRTRMQSLVSELESQQRTMNKLKQDLKAEKGLVATLRADKQALKQMTVNLQATAEVEEEYISNTLMKRIQQLQHEKGDLLMRVEAEEEMITNQLQKKLRQLQKDKVEMECVLEKEQEFMVNRLQKQLDELRGRVGNGPSVSTSSNKKWGYAHSSSSSMSELTSPSIAAGPGVIEVLKAELNDAKHRLQESEAANEEWRNTSSAHYQRLRQLTEMLILKQTNGSFPSSSNPFTMEMLDDQFPPTLPILKYESTSTPAPHVFQRQLSISSRSGSVARSPSASPIMGFQPNDSHPHAIPRSFGRSFG
ncbi:hypothetical protein BDV3_001881 [Batrachochytrium dendrobatidis]